MQVYNYAHIPMVCGGLRFATVGEHALPTQFRECTIHDFRHHRAGKRHCKTQGKLERKKRGGNGNKAPQQLVPDDIKVSV